MQQEEQPEEQQQQVDYENEHLPVERLFPNEVNIARKFNEIRFDNITYTSLKVTSRACKDLFIHLYCVVRVAQQFLGVSEEKINSTDWRHNFPNSDSFTTFSAVFREVRLFNSNQIDNATYFQHCISPFIYRNVNDFFILYNHYRDSFASTSVGIRKITRRLKELDYTLCAIRYLFRYIWAIRPIVNNILKQSPEFHSICRNWLYTYIDRTYVDVIEDVSLFLQGKMTQNYMEHVPYVEQQPPIFLHQVPAQSHVFYFENHESGAALTTRDGDELFTIYQVHRIFKEGMFLTRKLPESHFLNANSDTD